MNRQIYDYIEQTKKITTHLDTILNTCSLDCTVFHKRLDEEVIQLLDIEKPKIMVTGIYSSGKSTLINVLCKKKVAEVSARPQTDRISEYVPSGKNYTLIDSPGVDAPIEHEEITDEWISKCHIILFVISTGMFESAKNYEKLYKWVKSGKPFIIILNDKSNAKDIDLAEDIIRIRQKIIRNFNKKGISIHDYDVIAVNAKRAENGIFNGKSKLYEISNFEQLERKLDCIVERDNLLEMLQAPILHLNKILDDFEIMVKSELFEKDKVDYEKKLQIIKKIRNGLLSEINQQVRLEFEQKREILVTRILNERSMEDIWEDISLSVHKLYSAKMNEIMHEMNTVFPEYQFGLDNELDINLCNYTSHIMQNHVAKTDNDVDINTKKIIEKNGDFDSVGIKLNIGDELIKGAVLSTSLKKVLPTSAGSVLGESAIGGTLAQGNLAIPAIIIKIVGDLIISHKKEKERIHQLEAAVDKQNKELERAIEEQFRIKQQVNSQVTDALYEQTKVVQNTITKRISDIFDELEHLLIMKNQEAGKIKQETKELLDNLHDISLQTIQLRNRLNIGGNYE